MTAVARAPTSGHPRPPIAETGEPGEYLRLPTAPGAPSSWLRPDILWRSRNDVVAKLHDPVDDIREAWLALQGIPSGPARVGALRIPGHERLERPGFMVLGDTGEGDRSQMAVVPGLLERAAGAAFTVICSDVIYPAGEAADYPAKFHVPYAGLEGPIYGLPGNHDWYDRLVGFMTTFCGAAGAPPADTGRGDGLAGLLAHLLWRKAGRVPSPGANGDRAYPRPSPGQRGPYWSLDAGPVRLVGIDTGIEGNLDRAQGDWLLRVSAERPEAAKLLLTGKPLLVDGRYVPGRIAGHELTVDEVVRRREHGYVAAIGGDIHNYQRYPVTLPDGRRMLYVVAGGGGAFMHATHKIPAIEDPERGLAAELRRKIGAGTTVTELDTHLFPARAWSFYWFAQLLGRRWPQVAGLSLAEAGAVVGDALGLEPLDPEARALWQQYRAEGLPTRLRAAQTLLYERLPAPGRFFQRFLSEIFDSNKPPMAKSFLRLDAGNGELRLRCFQATGWRKDELDPPLEDEIVVPLAPHR